MTCEDIGLSLLHFIQVSFCDQEIPSYFELRVKDCMGSNLLEELMVSCTYAHI